MNKWKRRYLKHKCAVTPQATIRIRLAGVNTSDGILSLCSIEQLRMMAKFTGTMPDEWYELLNIARDPFGNSSPGIVVEIKWDTA